MLVDLEPRAGSEQGGQRPALVVSNDGFNRHFPLLTVLPLTRLRGKRRPVYGFEVLLRAGVAGNTLDSVVMPQQIRTLSQLRTIRVIGSLRQPELRAKVEDRLLEHLGIGLEDEANV